MEIGGDWSDLGDELNHLGRRQGYMNYMYFYRIEWPFLGPADNTERSRRV
jgi:hypothetical protein